MGAPPLTVSRPPLPSRLRVIGLFQRAALWYVRGSLSAMSFRDRQPDAALLFPVLPGGRAARAGSGRGGVPRAALGAVVWLAVCGASAVHAAAGAFGIHVIDEATGRGVPMVTLETSNRITLVTDSAGWAAFDEPGLTGRAVFFSVRSPGHACAENQAGIPGVTLETKPGLSVEVKVMRLGIAERAYRVTGQGIYREATRLGIEAPLPRPNLNGRLLAHGAENVVVWKHGFFWLWNEVRDAGPGHPFASIGAATSGLPGKGGLDLSLGVHFQYLDGAPLFNGEGAGRVRIEGLTAVRSAAGGEHLAGHYSRFRADGAREEHGIAEYNEGARGFEPVTSLGEEFAWQCPRGQAVRLKSADGDHFYFADPFCRSRVNATYEDLLDPSRYEALIFDPAAKAFGWRQGAAPYSREDEQRLLADKTLAADQARLRLSGAADGKDIAVHSSAIAWNGHRKKWIIIASEQRPGADAASGRLWYAEAATPAGAWAGARCIVDHDPLGLSDPVHLEAWSQDGGKVIYFDVTVVSGAPGGPMLPRYDQNRLMFRLDLTDRRLTAAAR